MSKDLVGQVKWIGKKLTVIGNLHTKTIFISSSVCGCKSVYGCVRGVRKEASANYLSLCLLPVMQLIMRFKNTFRVIVKYKIICAIRLPNQRELSADIAS